MYPGVVTRVLLRNKRCTKVCGTKNSETSHSPDMGSTPYNDDTMENFCPDNRFYNRAIDLIIYSNNFKSIFTLRKPYPTVLCHGAFTVPEYFAKIYCGDG